MKLLFLAESMNPGSQAALSLYFARKLSDFGSETAVMSSPGPFRDEFARWNVRFIPLAFPQTPFFRGFWMKKALKAARELKPEILHVLSPRHAARGVSLAAALGVPCFLAVNELPPRNRGFALPASGLAGVTAGTQEIREQLVNRHKVQRGLIRVIGAGVDTACFVPEGPSLDQSSDRIPVVGMVGRFERRKGGDVFMRAAAMVAGRGKRCHFLMAGDGPENEAWRQLARDLGIHRHLTFAVSTGDFRMLLNAIDVYVRPSLDSGTGLGIMEAMASARPVIATMGGNVYDLVEEGKTGFLVQEGDVAHLALCMMKLIDDPALATNMGRNARETAEKRFEIGDRARELLEFFRERLGRNA